MLKQLSVREKGESGVWGLLAELLRSGCIADGPEVSEIQAEARRCVFKLLREYMFYSAGPK
jgi:hypothetical protein